VTEAHTFKMWNEVFGFEHRLMHILCNVSINWDKFTWTNRYTFELYKLNIVRYVWTSNRIYGNCLDQIKFWVDFSKLNQIENNTFKIIWFYAVFDYFKLAYGFNLYQFSFFYCNIDLDFFFCDGRDSNSEPYILCIVLTNWAKLTGTLHIDLDLTTHFHCFVGKSI
jgi:hypothetical protein